MKDFGDRIVALLPGLRRFARSLCRNSVEADDLVQDSMMRALAARASWRGDNLRAWLTTIMVNQYRNDLRRGRTAPVTLPIDDWQANVPDTARGDPVEQLGLRAAIGRLTADQRVVLMLVVVEGFSYEEVAALLSIPVGTVMSRLSRARRSLDTMLNGDNVVELRRS
ncbi:MAG: RNA polymerase sigma factor [Salaquimonas sp.]|jgi:RNA polymerase sigma-70 factor (ECF subfamily)|nr:RNA polymerase sigma factor [Salaquimonas sp.]